MSVSPLDQATQLRKLMERGAGSPIRAPAPAAGTMRPGNARRNVPRNPLMRAVGEQLHKTTPAAHSLKGLLPAHRAARVVAIASGKGGVGKTNIAVSLAICLARRGRRVVLVDADLGTANIDVILNVQSHGDLSHVIRREMTLDQAMVRIEPGLHVIAGASGLSGVADLTTLQRQSLVDQLIELETRSDIILIDCGAGISQNILAFARAADELLVVTTPEPTALTDAYALIKVLSQCQRYPAMGIVVNQAETQREGHSVSERLCGVASRFLHVGVSRSGQILRDPHVAQAVRQRIPFISRYPRCPAATGIAMLAERVDHGALAMAGRVGFFERLTRFFY